MANILDLLKDFLAGIGNSRVPGVDRVSPLKPYEKQESRWWDGGLNPAGREYDGYDVEYARRFHPPGEMGFISRNSDPEYFANQGEQWWGPRGMTEGEERFFRWLLSGNDGKEYRAKNRNKIPGAKNAQTVEDFLKAIAEAGTAWRVEDPPPRD